VSRTTVGLVHGAWHGAWCWERLAGELERLGHDVVAVDLPAEDASAGLQRYAELTAEALGDRADVVLVGHSLGGATIPLVPMLRPVRHLVFLCALIPEPGKSVTDRYREEQVFVEGFAGNTEQRPDGGSAWPDTDAAIQLLFHDCLPADAAWAAARLRAQSAAPRTEPWPLAGIPDVERTSILCRDERCISPAWSRRMSVGQLEVEPVELGGGHSPFLSRPAELAAVIARVV
jgi:pimeloyl-ACP methyl ester carboxylesterase